jgi:hypothetical protein
VVAEVSVQNSVWGVEVVVVVDLVAASTMDKGFHGMCIAVSTMYDGRALFGNHSPSSVGDESLGGRRGERGTGLVGADLTVLIIRTAECRFTEDGAEKLQKYAEKHGVAKDRVVTHPMFPTEVNDAARPPHRGNLDPKKNVYGSTPKH